MDTHIELSKAASINTLKKFKKTMHKELPKLVTEIELMYYIIDSYKVYNLYGHQ